MTEHEVDIRVSTNEDGGAIFLFGSEPDAAWFVGAIGALVDLFWLLALHDPDLRRWLTTGTYEEGEG